MTRKVIMLAWVFLLLSLTACRDGARTINEHLARIDTLLAHELADSALRELTRIDTTTMGDDQKAYYQLLHVQALWKAYQPVSSDSLLDFSRVYYEKNGPQERLARTYYYIGAMQKELGLTGEAVENLKRAEHVAGKAGEKLLLSKVYNGLEDINFAAGDYETALRYAQMAVDCCREAGNAKLLVEDYEALAVAYHHVGQPDSALFYFEQCLPLVPQVRREDQAHVLANLGVCYKNLGYPQRAEELLRRSIEIEPLGFAYRSLAGLYAERDNNARAEEYYREALLLAERIDTRMSTLRGLRELKVRTGDYRAANALAEEISLLKDSLERQRQTANVGMRQQAFDHRMERRQMEHSRRRAWGWTAALFVLLAGAVAYFFRRKRQADSRMQTLQQQVAENAKAIDAVRQGAERAEGRMTELRKDNRKVKDQLFRTNERLEQLQHSQDSTVGKMRTDYERQLSHGCVLYEQIMAGGSAQKWYKQDFLDFEAYYGMRDIPFSVVLRDDYAQLTPQQRFSLILSHIGRTDEQIQQTMGLTDGAWRTMQSRMKKMQNMGGSL